MTPSFFNYVRKMFGTNIPDFHIVAGICCPPSDWAGNSVSRGLKTKIKSLRTSARQFFKMFLRKRNENKNKIR